MEMVLLQPPATRAACPVHQTVGISVSWVARAKETQLQITKGYSQSGRN